MPKSKALAAALLVVGLTLAGCGSNQPAVPTQESAPPAPTAAPASPEADEFPTAIPAETPVATEIAGSEQPAVEPGPGTEVAGAQPTETIPPGADQPAIEPGPGTPVPTPVATGEVLEETAPATEIDPRLEEYIRSYVSANSTITDFTIGDIAIEETTIRVRIDPTSGEMAWLFVRADVDGYAAVWGPGANLSQAEAESLGIPAALVPQG